MKRAILFLPVAVAAFAQAPPAGAPCTATSQCIVVCPSTLQNGTCQEVHLGAGCSIATATIPGTTVTGPVLTCAGPTNPAPSVIAVIPASGTQLNLTCSNLSALGAVFAATTCGSIAVGSPGALVWIGLTSLGQIHVGVSTASAAVTCTGMTPSCLIDTNVMAATGEYPVATSIVSYVNSTAVWSNLVPLWSGSTKSPTLIKLALAAPGSQTGDLPTLAMNYYPGGNAVMCVAQSTN